MSQKGNVNVSTAEARSKFYKASHFPNNSRLCRISLDFIDHLLERGPMGFAVLFGSFVRFIHAGFVIGAEAHSF